MTMIRVDPDELEQIANSLRNASTVLESVVGSVYRCCCCPMSPPTAARVDGIRDAVMHSTRSAAVSVQDAAADLARRADVARTSATGAYAAAVQAGPLRAATGSTSVAAENTLQRLLYPSGTSVGGNSFTVVPSGVTGGGSGSATIGGNSAGWSLQAAPVMSSGSAAVGGSWSPTRGGVVVGSDGRPAGQFRFGMSLDEVLAMTSGGQPRPTVSVPMRPSSTTNQTVSHAVNNILGSMIVSQPGYAGSPSVLSRALTIPTPAPLLP